MVQVVQQKSCLTTLIKIINYDIYQPIDTADETETVQQTDSRQYSRRTADGTPNKKDKKLKKGKEVKNNNISIPSYISEDLWNGFLEMRKDRKYPCTPHALKLALESIEKLKQDGQDPEACLKQTVERGYRGIFPISGNGKHPHKIGTSKTQGNWDLLQRMEEKDNAGKRETDV